MNTTTHRYTTSAANAEMQAAEPRIFHCGPVEPVDASCPDCGGYGCTAEVCTYVLGPCIECGGEVDAECGDSPICEACGTATATDDAPADMGRAPWTVAAGRSGRSQRCQRAVRDLSETSPRRQETMPP